MHYLGMRIIELAGSGRDAGLKQLATTYQTDMAVTRTSHMVLEVANNLQLATSHLYTYDMYSALFYLFRLLLSQRPNRPAAVSIVPILNAFDLTHITKYYAVG